MSRIACIALLILLSTHQPLIAKEGDNLIGKPAHEWGKLKWLNSEPLKLKDLKAKGRVVLIRWWTNTCPFCERSADALNEFHKDLSDDGLVVIGMYHPKPYGRHAPMKEITQAMKQLEFKFPIALDIEWKTLINYWLVPGKRRWTSVSFLIDKAGKIRYIHPGGEYHKKDGQAKRDYLELKAKIKTLLAEPKANAKAEGHKDAPKNVQ
jgi:peroxiredoxin